jgi:hypothetical protein
MGAAGVLDKDTLVGPRMNPWSKGGTYEPRDRFLLSITSAILRLNQRHVSPQSPPRIRLANCIPSERAIPSIWNPMAPQSRRGIHGGQRPQRHGRPAMLGASRSWAATLAQH